MEKEVPYVVVADDAFSLSDHLMKPYPQRGLTHDNKIFNYRLSRARRIIENAFGILANRFRVLLTPINLSVSKVEKICLASVILHNYLCTDNKQNNYTNLRDATEQTQLNGIQRQDGSNHSTNSARDIREEFKKYFNSQHGSVAWQENSIRNNNL